MVRDVERIKQKIILLFVVMIAFCGAAFLCGLEAEAATSTVKYHGSVVYGPTTSGVFTVNGKPAFCMQAYKSCPSSNTKLYESVYGNETARRILYYGWGGQKKWSGFKNKTMGYVITSNALDQVYSGNKHSYIPNYTKFWNYMKSQPAPPSAFVKFSKTKASVKWDTDKQRQVTETISIQGDKGGTISFTVPANVSLIKNNDTKPLNGKVTLKVGDQFRLEALQSVKGSWNTGNVGKKFKYQSILLKTKSSSIQNLGQGRMIEDKVQRISFGVDWLNLEQPVGSLEIRKTESETGKLIEGAEFTVYADEDIFDQIKNEKVYSKGDEVTKGLTGSDGKLKFTSLMLGKYMVKETNVPNGYLPNEKEYFFAFEKSADDATKTYAESIDVVNAPTVTELKKTDFFTSEEVEGAKMRLIDKEGKVIEEWTSGKEAHIIKGLTYGEEYVLHEETAPDGYELAEDVKFTVGSENKIEMKDRPKSITEVIKVESDSGEPLEGAILQIIDKDEVVKEEWTTTKEACVISGLNYDEEYTLHEVTAPAGYELAEDIKFIVGEKNEIKMEDKAKPHVFIEKEQPDDRDIFPITGDSASLFGLGIMFIGASISLMILLFVREKNLIK